MTPDDTCATVAACYAQVDAQTPGLLKQHGTPSCGFGCAHCCRQLVYVSRAEALYLARVILSRDDWRDLVLRLVDHAHHLEVKPSDDAATYPLRWFAKSKPCALLGDNGGCGVYAARPLACRLYFAFTPQDHCRFEDGNPRQATTLACGNAKLALWRGLGAATGDTAKRLDPLPIAVLAALSEVAVGGAQDSVARRARKLIDGKTFVGSSYAP